MPYLFTICHLMNLSPARNAMVTMAMLFLFEFLLSVLRDISRMGYWG